MAFARYFVLAACCLLSFAQVADAQNAGIRFNLTADAWNVFSSFLGPELQKIVSEMPPIALPNIHQEKKYVYKVDLTDITLKGLSFSALDAQLGSGELKVSLKKFAAALNCQGTWSVEGLHGKFTHIDISDGQVDATLAISAKNGRPDMKITKMDLQITLGTDLNVIVKDIIVAFLKLDGARTIKNTVNSLLTEKLGALPTEIHLDPKNLTVMDVSLSSLVVDPKAGIVVDVVGNAHAVNAPACQLPFGPMVAAGSSANLRLSVDAAVIQCAGAALVSSGALDDIVNSALPGLMKLDGRLALALAFKSFGPTTVSPATGLAVGVDFDAIITSKLFAPERFITINMNAATSFEVTMAQTVVNRNLTQLTVGGHLNNVTLGVNVTQIAADFPPAFAAQIASSNMAALSAQASGFFNGQVVPQVNAALAAGFAVPAKFATFTQLLKDPKFALYDGFFALEATVTAPPSLSVSPISNP
eukprot:TRINITY_DN8140_c1_g1_i1.p1 TRINITY_DN8140_c1_g1~~TRINITY_DN8140_c1_g1_i1.p1  ORF type:complete len:474 (+),score=111.51 TRINITY_DN8140_c1_g1_i1:112-1533(+)